MNLNERGKFADMCFEQSFEEGYYFEVVHAFCDFLTDAYEEADEDGVKYEHLMEVLKEKLEPEIFEHFFGDGFKEDKTPVYGYSEIGKNYGAGFYAGGKK